MTASPLRLSIIHACLIWWVASHAAAESSDLLEYRVLEDQTMEVVRCPVSATGAIEVPAEFHGNPVTSIGYLAFFGCRQVTSVSLPETITSLAPGAFAACSSLTSIVIPDAVTLIPEEAFADCSSLATVTFSSSLQIIDVRAFRDCAALKDPVFPPSLTTIGFSAFLNCRSLARIQLPAGLKVLQSWVFGGCPNITEFAAPPEAEHFASMDGVLFNKALTELVHYPASRSGAYVIPQSVVSIANNAFADCAGLTRVEPPIRLERIAPFAFQRCVSVDSFHVPASVIQIGYAAFAECQSLREITVDPRNAHFTARDGVLFNKTVTELMQFPIGRAADYIVPHGVTTIGYLSFSGADRLRSVQLPTSLRSVLTRAFEGCTSLTRIDFPAGVTEIGDFGYRDCTSLEEIRLPRGLQYISQGAFSGCVSLRRVHFPEGLQAIYQGAFHDCQSLTEVVIPAAVREMGGRIPFLDDFHGAFEGCGQLRSATFLGNAPEFMGLGVFGLTAPDFTVRYLTSRYNFSSPFWSANDTDVYPSLLIDDSSFPAAAWLLTHGYEFDTDLLQPAAGGAGTLLMAYALNLDPHTGTLPVPVRVGQTLRLGYYAGRPELRYRVETSDDLTHWATSGVDHTSPGADGLTRAEVPITASARFLRLIIERPSRPAQLPGQDPRPQ